VPVYRRQEIHTNRTGGRIPVACSSSFRSRRPYEIDKHSSVARTSGFSDFAAHYSSQLIESMFLTWNKRRQASAWFLQNCYACPNYQEYVGKMVNDAERNIPIGDCRYSADVAIAEQERSA
jgi:hypothetical protein